MDIFIFLDHSNYTYIMVCISAMVLVKDRNPLRVRILRLARVEMDYTMDKLENARFTFSSSARISLKSCRNVEFPVISRSRANVMKISNMFCFMYDIFSTKLLRKIECIVFSNLPLAFFIHCLTFSGKEHKGRSLVIHGKYSF